MVSFEWDKKKNLINFKKHGVLFEEAQIAFKDENRVIIFDEQYSKNEKRYFCIGLVDTSIITVRFTYRNRKIRIFGAGKWRKGKSIYEKKNKL